MTSDIALATEMQASGLISQEELDMLIADANGTEFSEDVIPGENPISTIDDNLAEVVETTLTGEDQRAAAYADQEDTGSAIINEEDIVQADTVPGDGSPAKVSRKPKSRKMAGPGKRVSRVAVYGTLSASAEAISTGYGVVVAQLPKKIQEKAVNWLDHFANGKPLSVFVEIALNELKVTGSLTSKRLVEVLNGTGVKGGVGYSIGTARSQAQQVFTLLPAMGVCTKGTVGGMTLILDEENAYWKQFVGI